MDNKEASWIKHYWRPAIAVTGNIDTDTLAKLMEA